MPTLTWLGVGTVAILATGAAVPRSSALPEVIPNDNRVPAGRLVGDTLHLSLVVRMATWHPEDPNEPGIDVAAFAEEGKEPQIPGPLIRVPEGTVLDVEIQNQLTDSTVTIGGMATRPMSPEDSTVLAPGARERLVFKAGAPGTYFYYANTGKVTDVERQQLAGAFIVDGPGDRTDDRIFVMNIWGDMLDTARYHNALAINGRSFPWNERISTNIGDTLRWRWINASVRAHPMHLHGFYFRVDSRGSLFGDTVFTAAQHRNVVTENMDIGTTMRMVWSPDRPGNWLFHCHIGFHVTAEDASLFPSPLDGPHRFSSDIGHHMAGLVLGISVTAPASWAPPPTPPPHAMRLLVQEGKRHGRAPRAMGFVLQQGSRLPKQDSVLVPGSLLVMHRGQPENITVVNRLNEPTSIHWHGIELESYWDGVVGWSGAGNTVAPRIEPGDSFVARLRLPRAGTFIYHTHLNDFEQFTSGMYGPIVVLEPGKRFDPRTDHVFVIGWDGPEDPPHIVLNGDSLPPAPLHFASGSEHRLRFINIGLAGRMWMTMVRDSALQQWRHVAKDGADLATGSTLEPARIMVQVGETSDVIFRPNQPGEYLLQIRNGDDELVTQQRIVVR